MFQVSKEHRGRVCIARIDLAHSGSVDRRELSDARKPCLHRRDGRDAGA